MLDVKLLKPDELLKNVYVQELISQNERLRKQAEGRKMFEREVAGWQTCENVRNASIIKNLYVNLRKQVGKCIFW